MKKLIITTIAAAALLTGAAVYAKEKHPNLHAAHEMVVKAIAKIDAAQKANEYDMGGHAQKARDLLSQAEGELRQAAETANAKDKGKK